MPCAGSNERTSYAATSERNDTPNPVTPPRPGSRDSPAIASTSGRNDSSLVGREFGNQPHRAHVDDARLADRRGAQRAIERRSPGNPARVSLDERTV